MTSMNTANKIAVWTVAACFSATCRTARTADRALTEPPFLPDSALVAHYSFRHSESPGRDTSGHGHDASLRSRPKITTAKAGAPVLKLDGESGLVLPGGLLNRLRSGFSIEFRVRFREVRPGTTLLLAEKGFLLRLDPGKEGAHLSFFVYVDDSWEPRVRTIVPEAGRWYHVAVSWDGVDARAFVDDRVFSVRRCGNLPEETPAEIVVGAPSPRAGNGLIGEIADLRFSARPFTEGTFLARTLGLSLPPAKIQRAVSRTLDVRFARGAAGWRVTGGGSAEIGPNGMTALLDRKRFVVSPALSVPAESARWLAVELRVQSAAPLGLLLMTSTGERFVPLPVPPDGAFHVVTLPIAGTFERQADILAIALGPRSGQCEVTLSRLGTAATRPEWPDVRIVHFDAGPALLRAGRGAPLELEIENQGCDLDVVRCELEGTESVRIESGADVVRLENVVAGDRRTVTWPVTFSEPGDVAVRVRVFLPGAPVREAVFRAAVSPPPEVRLLRYPPEPHPIETGGIMIGAQYCPLWRQGTRRTGWERIVSWPKRKPVLGWYDEGNPEVADWEISWCLDHGISFFMYCWYRNGQGRPVTPDDVRLEHAIRQGLFHARYRDQFKFAVMWENARRGIAGVSSMDDLMENLFPYWLNTFFKHPRYLCVDRRPLLFIYRPEYLVDDLGGVGAVRKAFARMREECRKAGFDGLWIVGEYRGTDAKRLRLLADLGCDYVFAYCWPLPGSPSSPEAVRQQIRVWRTRRTMNILPEILTVSMGWDARPWHASPSRWRLTPADFARACSAALDEMKQWPKGILSRRILLLDNWNEFGEGHYIAPHREYGFGYLDAVRRLFVPPPDRHIDLTPEDVGLGPYDSLFRRWLAERAQLRRLRLQKLASNGAEAPLPGVVAWWRFDEKPGTPVALDYSGRRLGGLLHDIRRTQGYRGQALECRGGAVTVPATPRLETGEITIECRIWTAKGDQNDRWILNRIRGGATDAGYRLGLTKGRPCWAVPLASWSHHLVASKALPLNRWVHLAATADGRNIRLYMDGEEIATMKRPGPVKPTDAPLVLGNFAVNHRAFFRGKLDEVRIWDRALSPEEIRALAAGTGDLPVISPAAPDRGQNAPGKSRTR